MNRVAKFKIEYVFKITGRGLAFAGRIIDGKISIGNTIRFSINRMTYDRKITGVEGIRHSNTKKVNVGLLIQCIDSEEIEKLIKSEKNLRIEVDIFNNKPTKHH